MQAPIITGLGRQWLAPGTFALFARAVISGPPGTAIDIDLPSIVAKRMNRRQRNDRQQGLHRPAPEFENFNDWSQEDQRNKRQEQPEKPQGATFGYCGQWVGQCQSLVHRWRRQAVPE